MKKVISLLLMIFIAPTGFSILAAETVTPRLIFQSRKDDANYKFKAPRNFTIDKYDNLYIFDYFDYTIKKYDKQGKHLLTFGGKGTEAGKFTHLMAIKTFHDTFYALDSVAMLTFTLNGVFKDKKTFRETALCNHPKMSMKLRFAGEQILDKELKEGLTFRDAGGTELARVASYDLREFFPDLKKGEDFFLKSEQARFYLYDMTGDGRLFWAASDKFEVFEFKNGTSSKIISAAKGASYTPVDFPADKAGKLSEKKEAVKKRFPHLHMNVPSRYQLLHHLLVGPGGDLWLYVKSKEKNGFMQFSAAGKHEGFYPADPDFNMLGVHIIVHGGQLYFMRTRRSEVKIYTAALPN
jgi:hypothetical protein